LFEAIGLVSWVMLLFYRASAPLHPDHAVPVVLLGTFGSPAGLRLSINTLTMFG